MIELERMFQHAEIKLEWARRHENITEKYLQQFIDQEPHSFEIRQPSQECQTASVMMGSSHIDAAITLSLGDTIHNCRSALDYAWMACVRQFEGPNIRGYFPFDKHESELLKRVRHKTLKWPIENIDRLFEDKIRSHLNGNINLYLVSRLDNINKHNLIIPSLNSFTVHNLQTKRDSSSVSFGKVVIEANKTFPVIGLGGSGDLELTYEKVSGYTVTINGDALFKDKEISALMSDLVSATSDALEIFTSYILSNLDQK